MKKRKQCEYPWSLFYIYEDEIPEGERVSTEKDCEECEDSETCDCKHCLIGD